MQPTPRVLRGNLLSWIVGRDCVRGMQAYLRSADMAPDAALIGTGWIEPTTGELLTGGNNCASDSHSMDSVVQVIHQHGGMAYLTVTMWTDGTADAWTPQQEAEYIAKATGTQGYIDAIGHEGLRGHYDGVIMDLEATPADYPSIQRLFAIYNQHLWAALKATHKSYGIALIHKVSDHDDAYVLNGFQDWRLLAHTADFMVIMALDQSYRTPGPGVSLPWLKQILAYARQTMPDMVPHMIWELPLYGATWHQAESTWVYDGTISYQDAETVIDQISPSQEDVAESNLDDPTSAHITYDDEVGVKHALWSITAQNFIVLVTAFQQIIGPRPLQVAAWYRTTSEPRDFWLSLKQVSE